MATALLAVKSFFITCFTCLLSLAQIFSPYGEVILNGEDSFFENWSAETEFTRDYAVEIEKTPGKDFKILNLTDIQLSAFEPYMEEGLIAFATIDKLVKEQNPDLITLTGDNAWSTMSYIKVIEVIDSYGIPWAPIMGNHDGQSCLSEFWCAYQFTQAENCLFKFGPKDMGYGNYIINITENGKIIHTLFMMDTHSDIEDEGNINGEVDSGYDHLWPNQIEWYKWAVNGIKKIAGHTVPSTVLFHIPVVEYLTAYEEAYDENAGAYRAAYAETSFGVKHEGVCSAPKNNGFFQVCKELGSTKDMICGHDHVNDFSVVYQGIRLTYAVKTGPGCYWEEDMNGGTTLTINSDGVNTVEHIFVDPATLEY